MGHDEHDPGRGGRGYTGYGGVQGDPGRETGPKSGFTGGYLGSYGYGPWYGWGNGPWYGEGRPGMPGPRERRAEPGPWRRGEWRPGERHGGHATKGVHRAEMGGRQRTEGAHPGTYQHRGPYYQGMRQPAKPEATSPCPTCGRDWPTGAEREEKKEALERYLEGLKDETRGVKHELERLESMHRH